MKLFNELSKNDINTIETYAKRFSYTSFDIGVEKFLEEWDKNKRKLYKLLGNKMIHEFKCVISEANKELKEEIQDFLRDSSFFFNLAEKIKSLYFNDNYDPEKDDFIHFLAFGVFWSPRTFAEHVITNSFENIGKRQFAESKTTLVENGKKILKIDPKMKPMKLIKKLIDYFGDQSLLDDFEDFRIGISMLQQKLKKNTTICISIHPMDFMTMSDNNNNWSSCMSWKEKGCFRNGTLEMMNSNNVMVIYTKSEKKLTKINPKTNWNSKTWRTLGIFTKHVIITGKQYPNPMSQLPIEVLKELKRLAETNLGWDYMGEIENYGANEYYADRQFELKTDFMYNDFYNDDTYRHYYMLKRDPMNEKKYCFSYSGKIFCLQCGVRMKNVNSYYDREHMFLCNSCANALSHEKDSCDCCCSYTYINNLIKLERDCSDTAMVCKDCFSEVVMRTDGEYLKHELRKAYFSDNTTLIKNILKMLGNTHECNFIRISYSEYNKLVEKGYIDESTALIKEPISTKADAYKKISELLS